MRAAHAESSLRLINPFTTDHTDQTDEELERLNCLDWKQILPESSLPPFELLLSRRQKPEAADDVYALACLSYELLSGLHPFDDGSGATTAKFPPPRRAGMTAVEHAAIVHGLQRDRDNRTATVTQFIDEFAPPRRVRAAGARGAAWAAAAVLAVLAAVMWFVRHPSPVAVPAARADAHPKRPTGRPVGCDTGA